MFLVTPQRRPGIIYSTLWVSFRSEQLIFFKYFLVIPSVYYTHNWASCLQMKCCGSNNHTDYEGSVWWERHRVCSTNISFRIYSNYDELWIGLLYILHFIHIIRSRETKQNKLFRIHAVLWITMTTPTPKRPTGQNVKERQRGNWQIACIITLGYVKTCMFAKK